MNITHISRKKLFTCYNYDQMVFIHALYPNVGL